jgi:hypothetical protein
MSKLGEELFCKAADFTLPMQLAVPVVECLESCDDGSSGEDGYVI